MFCTMKKLQPTFSSERWKQNQTLLRGAQYRWGNAHNFQWGKLQLEIRKKNSLWGWTNAGKVPRVMSPSSEISKLYRTRGTSGWSWLGFWPCFGHGVTPTWIFCDSWATTSHFVLPQKPEQTPSLVLLYCVDLPKIPKWFLISNWIFLATRYFLLSTYLLAEVLSQTDVASCSAPIPQLTPDSEQAAATSIFLDSSLSRAPPPSKICVDKAVYYLYFLWLF